MKHEHLSNQGGRIKELKHTGKVLVKHRLFIYAFHSFRVSLIQMLKEMNEISAWRFLFYHAFFFNDILTRILWRKVMILNLVFSLQKHSPSSIWNQIIFELSVAVKINKTNCAEPFCCDKLKHLPVSLSILLTYYKPRSSLPGVF